MYRRQTAVLRQPPRIAAPRLGGFFTSRNVRALADHVGCSEAEAGRLYELSRIHGYGAAFSMVFPDEAAAEHCRALARRGAPAGSL